MELIQIAPMTGKPAFMELVKTSVAFWNVQIASLVNANTPTLLNAQLRTTALKDFLASTLNASINAQKSDVRKEMSAAKENALLLSENDLLPKILITFFRFFFHNHSI